MNIQIPEYIQALMDLLKQHHHTAYLVGGAVRNTLLQQPVHDYDLTTDATPQEMKNIFHAYKTFETGIQHGTITVLSKGHPVEITTFRSDVNYIDHRHPTAVRFSRNIRDDCKRRDFTVNALCYNTEEGLLDFFGGLKDLSQKVLRCIGDPEERFHEDALRILRALRFAGRLRFNIEKQTAQAIHRKKELLHYISAERIHAEWTGILQTQDAAEILLEYHDVIAVFLPELNAEDIKKKASALQKSMQNHLIRMAILLSGFDHSEKTLRRLTYSNAEMKVILECIKHMHANMHSKIECKQLLSVLSIPFPLYHAYRTAIDDAYPAAQMMSYYEEIIANHEPYCLKDLAIDGNDVKNIGYRGKEIFVQLQRCLMIVINDPAKNTEKYLSAIIKRTV